jgi:hypothetical protein
MPFIAAFAVTVVAAVSVSLAGLIIVVILGIRHEERVWSISRRAAPGLAARLARLVVGLYNGSPAPRPVRRDDHAEPARPLTRR